MSNFLPVLQPRNLHRTYGLRAQIFCPWQLSGSFLFFFLSVQFDRPSPFCLTYSLPLSPDVSAVIPALVFFHFFNCSPFYPILGDYGKED